MWDFNFDLLMYFVKTLDININIELTQNYDRKPPKEIDDFRGKIHPKSEFHDPQFNPQYYAQVFEDRLGFLPNLSILDLLLCCGRASKSVLQQCIVEPSH